MSRYIDEEKLWDNLEQEGCDVIEEHWDLLADFGFSRDLLRRCIEKSLVDVEPIEHGHWIEKSNIIGEAYCSECGYALRLHNTNYCPNCGAMMDER